MAEEIILDDVPGDPPFVRKPLSEQKRVKLPPYPGLPSETGKSSAMIVSRQPRKKKEKVGKPGDITDEPRSESGSEPKPE